MSTGGGILIYGYARVSTADQSLDLQKDALRAAGVVDGYIFSDVITGMSAASVRPEFGRLLSLLQGGDVVYIWKLDRLGRSILDVIQTIVGLTERDVIVRSLNDGIDTGTPLGRALAAILASFAQLERDNISIRVKAGMAAAKERGKDVGRPRKATREIGNIARRYLDQGVGVSQISRNLGLSRGTIYKSLDLVSV